MDFLSEPGFEPTTLGYLGFQVQLSIRPTTALLDAFPVFGSNVQVRMKTTSVC